MTIELNVYHTIAIAIVILIAGEAIRRPGYGSSKILYTGTCSRRPVMYGYNPYRA